MSQTLRQMQQDHKEPSMSESIQRPNLGPAPTPEELKLTRRASRRYGLFAPALLKAAFKQAFVMLRPDIQWKNPVMFVVEVGTALTIVFSIARLLGSFPHISLG